MASTNALQTWGSRGLDLGAVGRRDEPALVSWTWRDVALYALGVGAAQENPFEELSLTTENTAGVPMSPLPTFAVVAGRWKSTINLDMAQDAVLHGQQSLIIHEPLPVEGSARVSTTVDGIFDMGSGALVVLRTALEHPDSRQALVESTAGIFVRGEGGFGGPRPPRRDWSVPATPPDLIISAPVRTDQALLYRLSGDSNPLHSDPAAASRAGFEAPILHGLCTYGITARLLVNHVVEGDPTRMTAIECRFVRPVVPGGRLDVHVWLQTEGVIFQTYNEANQIVLDRGRCSLDLH